MQCVYGSIAFNVTCMSAQLCGSLHNPMDFSPPGSYVHRILQARILGWVSVPHSRTEPTSPVSPALAGGFFTPEPPGKPTFSFIKCYYALYSVLRFFSFNITMLKFIHVAHHFRASQVASGKEPACQCQIHRDAGSIPGWGRSPGEGHGNPLQFSCLENPIDRGAWWATVERVTKS